MATSDRGASADTSPSAEDKPAEDRTRALNPRQSESTSLHHDHPTKNDKGVEEVDEDRTGENDEESHHQLEHHTAIRFLLAGGIAGAGMSLSLP